MALAILNNSIIFHDVSYECHMYMVKTFKNIEIDNMDYL